MKNLNVLKIVVLLMLAVGLSACGDEYYTDDYLRNSTEKMAAYTWTEDTTTEEGELCKHQLKFSKDYSGREIFRYYRSGASDPYRESSFTFNWKWTNDAMENIEMNYGAGDLVHFSNVWVRQYNLSGKLNGVMVMMAAER